MKLIDNFLDALPMYRVVLYGLFSIIEAAFIFSFLQLIPVSPLALLLSFVTLLIVCVGTHYAFSSLYKVKAHVGSSLITAFILFLILAPVEDLQTFYGAIFVGVCAIVSKYVFAYRNKHIFNPAALALVIGGIAGVSYATWWIGSMYLLPVVVVASFLIVKKVRRSAMFFAYIIASTGVVLAIGGIQGVPFIDILTQHFISWSTVFFAAVMLTEPLSTPPTRRLQIIYAVIVGVIASIPYHFGFIYGTPELALIIGNVFAYLVSTKSRPFLTLKEKVLIAKDTYEFVFTKQYPFVYQAGQYMEWTLDHTPVDDRGTRRYFTIASSPTDEYVRLGVKMVPEEMRSSTFKHTLKNLTPGAVLSASSVSGDFLLPSSLDRKLVFIAGGIGITPYISMLRLLLEKKEKRNITLFYCVKTKEDIAYKDVLDRVKFELGCKVVFIFSDVDDVGVELNCEKGFLTGEILAKYDCSSSHTDYYLSGPPGMVASYKTMLLHRKVSRFNIITDYFPGFA